MIGRRLGPYEITAKLGEGGMGVVWRARDSHLGREVALKVLPEAFTADPERLARFEREAKLLAQLNHPNIAQIHGLEVSGETRALVMELVEGPTLAERLEAGSLLLDDCLSIARQVAEALEEAHEKGIVHRDLKPQNIKASIEGKVKVLDFGLAKALDTGSGFSSPSEMAHSPTVTFGGTREGVILGTAAYMSPEQARGGAIDKRADIWAFGVVLYEMLAGERLFSGESVVDVLGSVMRQPIDFDRLPATTPRRLRELVRRCLERSPKNRLRDIGDARIALVEILAFPDAPRGESAIASTAVARTRGRWLALAAAAAIGVLAGAVIGGRVPDLGRPATSPKPSFRFQKLTYLPGVEWAPELSADGKTLFFAAGDANESELYSVPVGGKKPAPLTSGSHSFYDSPRLSPDGSHLVFASSRDGGGLFLMGVNGESVRKLSEVGNDPAWSPNGLSVAFSTEEVFLPYDGIDGGKVGVVDVSSGSQRMLETGDAHQPAWSPSGRRIAYWGIAVPSGNREIWTIAVDGGSPLVVASDPAVDWNPVWSADGRYLYFLSDRGGAMNLWRVGIGEASGRQSGAPESVPLPADEVIYLARSGNRWVYSAYSSRSQIERLEFDPTRSALVGAARPVLSTTRSVRTVEASPDGKRLAFTTVRPQEDLYVVAAEGGTPTQVTDDREFDRYPSWVPDGERILFESDRGKKYEMWGIRPDGSGLRMLTRTKVDPGWFPALSPRADRLVVSQAHGIAIYDASGPPPWERFESLPPPATSPGANFSGAIWSPNGDRLAGYVYRGNEPRQAAVLDLASKSYRLFEPTSRSVGWYPDGRRLLIVWQRQLAVLELATWSASPVPGSPELRGRVSASRDLRTIVTLEDDPQADIWLAEEMPPP
jgi:serine/threonine protein kinase